MKISSVLGYGVLLLVLYWLYQSGIITSLFGSITSSLPGSGTIPLAATPVAGVAASTPAAWYIAPTCNSTTPSTCPSGTVVNGVLVRP